MKRYEITYMYDGKKHSIIEQPQKGFEGQFLQQVLNRIESLVSAGAIIVDMVAYRA